MKRLLISLLLCAACLLGACPCAAAQEIEIFGREDVQSWIDEELAPLAGKSAEWYIIALSQSGAEYDYSAYRRELAGYMKDNDSLGAVTRQKLALAMLAAGGYDKCIAAIPDETIGEQGIMSCVFGLHLVANGCESTHTVPELVDQLLTFQLEDGGWALFGEKSDVDVTAMVLQAIAPHHVGEETDRALALLSQRQEDNGGYSSMGECNAESTAQVVVALCAMGIDCRTDERFIKNGVSVFDALQLFACDGGYSHVLGGDVSESASMQAACAKVAVNRFDAGKGSLYVLDGGLPEMKEETGGVSYKVYASLAALLLGLAGCVWLMIKKRPVKSYIALAVCVLGAIVLILVTNISSAEDYYTPDSVENPAGTVTLTVRCDTVAGQSQEEHIPQSGVILPEVAVAFERDESVIDVTVRAAREHGLQLDSESGSYVRGINYLYEFDFGDLSGWICVVNGDKLSVGSSQYKVHDGDVIEWLYTCELGNDL